MDTRPIILAVAALCIAAAAPIPAARAGDQYVSVPWSGLRFEEPAPKLPPERIIGWSSMRLAVAKPYVVLDGRGEAFVHYEPNEGLPYWMSTASSISLRADESEPLKGRLVLTDAASSTLSVHRFEVVTPDTDVDARRRFYEDMQTQFDQHLQDGRPGAAWFRHRRDEARRVLESGPAPERFGLQREPADPLDLFTGARAVAENLDFDRSLRVPATEEATVPIDSIEGVTTRAYDWKPLLEGKDPTLDPLAHLVPADQHAVFFPTFDALVRVLDEIDAQGTPLLAFFDARVEDSRLKDRYQAQLLLPLSTLARTLGPAVISSVVVTGSDPFLPGGTDIALLFECKQPAILEGLLAARRAEAEKGGAAHVEGALGVEGTPGYARYVGAEGTDRRVSSYVARFGSAVVVTNSTRALMRIAEVLDDPTRSLVTADEYRWFRDRYPRADAKESALLVLTDATIRRWAGPRSRIGDARRLSAAAVMAEIQARHMDELVGGTLEAGASARDADFPISADFVWTKDGVRSPKWGSLEFLTPISELDLERVSPAEQASYEVFRTTFQSRWRTYFDPIAVHLELDGARLRADATIRPLVLDSEYGQIQSLTRGAVLAAGAGDPHENALFHLALAFAPNSELGRMFTGATGSLASRFGPDPLAWLGSSIALYGERDPWWEGMRSARRDDEPEDVNYYAIPLAVHIAVKDPLKLAGFMTALRALADQSAPNITRWESRTWQEIGYVRVSANEDVGLTEPGVDAALYYVTLPDALVLSLREDLIQQSIERHLERKAGRAPAGSDRAWLGRSAGLRFDREAIDSLATSLFDDPQERAAQAAWSALPILDEWKRLYPDQDPVALHERVWGVRLVAPGGASFSWSEELSAMVSDDYGRPGARERGQAVAHALPGVHSAELGLTFEDDGLRAVVEIRKEP